MSNNDITIDDTGITIPDTEEIYNNISDEWNIAFGGNMSRDITTPQGQLITSLVTQIDNKNNQLLYILNMLNPKTSSGIWQDAIGYLFFLERKKAQSSIVRCECIGLANTFIPKGSLVKSDRGDLFESTEDKVISDNGNVTISFSSLEKGLIPVERNSINTIVTTIVGWDSVNNKLEKGIIGRLAESRYDFENRRINSIAKNGKSTVSSLYARLRELDGVMDVYVRENKSNRIDVYDNVEIKPHSVYCCVNGGNNYMDIANTIENTISSGCSTTGNTKVEVLIPENNVLDIIYYQIPEEINIVINIQLKKIPESYSNDIPNIVKDYIYNNYYGLDNNNITTRVSIGETVYASRFYQSIALIAGVYIISIKIGKVETNIKNRIKLKNIEQLSDSVYIPIDKVGILTKDNIEVIVNE